MGERFSVYDVLYCRRGHCRGPSRVGAARGQVPENGGRHSVPLRQTLLLQVCIHVKRILSINSFVVVNMRSSQIDSMLFSSSGNLLFLLFRNRELVYDLYTYLWDMCGVVQTLDGFVQWMSKGSVSPKSQNYVVGQQTWFSGIREAFSSGDHEPWMFRGEWKTAMLKSQRMISGFLVQGQKVE